MSGRSAYVRKQKTKVKEPVAVAHDSGPARSNPSLKEFYIPSATSSPYKSEKNASSRTTTSDRATIRSHNSERSDDLAYARVRKPPVPVIDVSGIEKSSFRALMDNKSDGVRKGIAKAFGGKKKKKNEEQRPATSSTVRPANLDDDSDDESAPSPDIPRSRQPQLHHKRSVPVLNQNRPDIFDTNSHEHDGRPLTELDYLRVGPPKTQLPPVPLGPQLKRWRGHGKAPEKWNKLHKDPELWDPNGDTLVFLCHPHDDDQPPPSFRLSSHVIENTESRYLLTMLQKGALEENNPVFSPRDGFSMPPSPNSSGLPYTRREQPTPPASDPSLAGLDGQISYEMYFPVPYNRTNSPNKRHNEEEKLRHNVTTRNVFAILYRASLVGLNFYHALTDVQDRLETWMPSDHDVNGQMTEYIVDKGFDDVRNDPSQAAAILAWSEAPTVRWEEGWRETFVHTCGMYGRVEETSNFRFISPISRALLQRASLALQVKVSSVEMLLSAFDFSEMWPMMSAQPSHAQAAFNRMMNFCFRHYQSEYGTWPPPTAEGSENWLTRALARKLQTDFGALYDYLVNREVVFDGSLERNGRKWSIVNEKDPNFNPDSRDLPFTDLLAAFDNRNRYPHIPHPYPRIPDTPVMPTPNKGEPFSPRARDRMAERKAALAYTESTNIYLLGSDFVANDLVEEFVDFEKNDRSGDGDLAAARKGRWVLIYGVLQVLGSVAVDTPCLRYTDDVMYHLSPRMNGTPPWRGQDAALDEATHVGSHCWVVRHKWIPQAPFTIHPHPHQPLPLMASSRTLMNFPAVPRTSSATPSVSGYSERDSDAGSHRSNSLVNASRGPRKKNREMTTSEMMSYTGYGAGIEKLGEWPIYEESRRIQTAVAKAPQQPSPRSGSRAGSGNRVSPSKLLDFNGGNNESVAEGEQHSRAASATAVGSEPPRSRAGSIRERISERRELLHKEFKIGDIEGLNFRDPHPGLEISGDWKLNDRGI